MDDLSPDGSTASSLRLPGRRFDDVPGLQAEGAHLLRGASGEPAAEPGGDQGGERGALARASRVRFPDLRELQGRERVDALIDHITATAIARGELEELRLEAYTNLFTAQRELSTVPCSTSRSKAAIDEFKRQARPDLGERIDGARWLIDRCSEQIARMGGSEYDAASRSYTLLSG